jgi:anti-anti-sigma factor
MLEEVVIRGQQEIDYDTVELEQSRIERAGDHAKTVVLDLSGTRFFSSAGVAAILEAHRRLDARDKRLVVVAPLETPVGRLLEMASLRDLLLVVDRLPLQEPSERTARANASLTR